MSVSSQSTIFPGEGQNTTRLVRVAPDWLPNTNHIGFYVAIAQGYYHDEGLALDILPFDGEAMPNRKIVSGETDFGLMPHQSIISMRARGVPVVSVASLLQPNVTTLYVRADSAITRPSQLAGKRYASFGTEFEIAMVNEMISLDGGTGTVEVVSAEKLDIAAALASGALDVAWGFYAWEGIQLALAGLELRHFFVAAHGLPAEYFPLLFTTTDLIERDPTLVRAFVRATERGYLYAAAHPDEAADIFVRAVPADVLPAQGETLVRESWRWLAPRLLAERVASPTETTGQSTAPWGWHDAPRWSAFASFIRRLASEQGLPAPESEAETAGYTNAFLSV